MRALMSIAALALVAGASDAAARCTEAMRRDARKTLDARSAEYLERLFHAKPHLATFMGDHRFDDRLPDVSPAALDARQRELEQQRARMEVWEGCEGVKAPLDAKIDAAILFDGIDLELLYLREIRDWTWDPRLHDSFPYYDPREIVAGRLSDIIHGDAPEAERRAAVIAQLRALPTFLAQMKAALKNPARVYTEQAIKDNRGRIEVFQTEVKEFLKGDADGEKARAIAVATLQGYQSFLENDLLPRSKGDWRLGAALYRKKFPLALQTTLTPEEVVPRAEAAFRAARAELSQVARQLHRKLWPGEPLPEGGADARTQAALIARVRDELHKDHPKPTELVQAHAGKLEGLRAFIREHDLLTLPPAETLAVKEMPPFKRGASGAEYLAPGVLEKKPVWHSTYYVDPVDPSWPPEKTESYLRANNDYRITLTAAHEAYPGHHTQFSYARKELNPLRAVLWNGAMAEGWAVYGEDLITRLGLGGARNLGFRFETLTGRMVVATNAILDVKLQSGEMTDEEALHLMIDEGFQERALAEKKLLRAKLDSTQLAQYFLGYAEISDLEAAAKKKLGRRFTARVFDEALISHGTLAVKHLRRYLLSK